VRYWRGLPAWPAKPLRRRGGYVMSAVQPVCIEPDAGFQHEVPRLGHHAPAGLTQIKRAGKPVSRMNADGAKAVQVCRIAPKSPDFGRDGLFIEDRYLAPQAQNANIEQARGRECPDQT